MTVTDVPLFLIILSLISCTSLELLMLSQELLQSFDLFLLLPDSLLTLFVVSLESLYLFRVSLDEFSLISRKVVFQLENLVFIIADPLFEPFYLITLLIALVVEYVYDRFEFSFKVFEELELVGLSGALSLMEWVLLLHCI